MSRRTLGVVGVALGMGLVSWACLAQEPGRDRGAAQKVGERIDDAARSIKRGVKEVGEGVRERFARVRQGVHNMGVESRIYGRLHWDKDLNTATIELEVQKDGLVVLRGSVPDAAAKAKAETLAKETVGVNRVVNGLGVTPPPTQSVPPAPR